MKLLVLLIPLFAISGCGQPSPAYKIVSMSEAAKQNIGQSKEVSDFLYGFDTLREYEVGSYKCYIPESGEQSLFFCSDGDKLVFYKSKFGVSLPLNGKAQLQITDKNKDGIYDQLNFDVLDNEGNIKAIIFDHNLDGRADLRIVLGKGVEVFVDGRWMLTKNTKHKKEGLKKFEVSFDGKVRSVVWNGESYIFAQ